MLHFHFHFIPHVLVLQSADSDDKPLQSFPSHDGDGLVHVLVLVLVPVPHVAEQVV